MNSEEHGMSNHYVGFREQNGHHPNFNAVREYFEKSQYSREIRDDHMPLRRTDTISQNDFDEEQNEDRLRAIEESNECQSEMLAKLSQSNSYSTAGSLNDYNECTYTLSKEFESEETHNANCTGGPLFSFQRGNEGNTDREMGVAGCNQGSPSTTGTRLNFQLPSEYKKVFERISSEGKGMEDYITRAMDQLPSEYKKVFETLSSEGKSMEDYITRAVDQLPSEYKKVFEPLSSEGKGMRDYITRAMDQLPSEYKKVFEPLSSEGKSMRDFITKAMEPLKCKGANPIRFDYNSNYDTLDEAVVVERDPYKQFRERIAPQFHESLFSELSDGESADGTEDDTDDYDSVIGEKLLDSQQDLTEIQPESSATTMSNFGLSKEDVASESIPALEECSSTPSKGTSPEFTCALSKERCSSIGNAEKHIPYINRSSSASKREDKFRSYETSQEYVEEDFDSSSLVALHSMMSMYDSQSNEEEREDNEEYDFSEPGEMLASTHLSVHRSTTPFQEFQREGLPSFDEPGPIFSRANHSEHNKAHDAPYTEEGDIEIEKTKFGIEKLQIEANVSANKDALDDKEYMHLESKARPHLRKNQKEISGDELMVTQENRDEASSSDQTLVERVAFQSSEKNPSNATREADKDELNEFQNMAAAAMMISAIRSLSQANQSRMLHSHLPDGCEEIPDIEKIRNSEDLAEKLRKELSALMLHQRL